MTHLCLVSDQPVPNLLPALEPAVRPERVVLAVSPQMAHQAQRLAAALQRHQIATDVLQLTDAYDLHSLGDAYCGFLDTHAAEDVALNVTGGTKPMAIAAQEAFRMAGKSVFYVSVETDKLVWLDPGQPAVPLTHGPGLVTFLLAHGYTGVFPEARSLPAGWQRAVDGLVAHAGDWGRAIGRLNAIAKEAEGRKQLDARRVDSDDAGPWDDMLQLLYACGIVTHYDDRVVRFASETARFFANGGWLEHHVYRVVRDLTGIREAAMNLTVTDESGNRNELDTAFLFGNRLFIVECKTRRFDQDARATATTASDAIYKLDSQRRFGGLRTHGILVSYLPMQPAHKKRAAANDLLVVDGKDLPILVQRVQGFLKQVIPSFRFFVLPSS